MAYFNPIVLNNTPRWLNLIPTPNGGQCIFFGDFPQQVVLAPPVAASLLAQPMQEEEEEVYTKCTQKGLQNHILDAPPQSLKRKRRQPTKASKEKALETYQTQLVADLAIPVSNSFTPLRIVRRNSPTAQIRHVWEVPQPEPLQNYKPHSNPAKRVTPIQAIHKAHKMVQERNQRKGRSWTRVQKRNLTPTHQEPRVEPRVSIKSRLTCLSRKTGKQVGPSNPSIPRIPEARRTTQKWVLKPRSNKTDPGPSYPRRVDNPKNKPTRAHHNPKESVFDRLGPKMEPTSEPIPKSLIVTVADKNRKKRRVARYAENPEAHAFCYAISIASEEDDPIDEEIKDDLHAHCQVIDNNPLYSDPSQEMGDQGQRQGLTAEESDVVRTRAQRERERAEEQARAEIEHQAQLQAHARRIAKAAKQVTPGGPTNEEEHSSSRGGTHNVHYDEEDITLNAAINMVSELQRQLAERDREMEEYRRQKDEEMRKLQRRNDETASMFRAMQNSLRNRVRQACNPKGLSDKQAQHR